MKSSHSRAAVFAAFDDPNLLAHGRVAAAVRLAERCALPDLVREKVRPAGAGNGAGAAPDAKAMSLVAGMLAGADNIDDVAVCRRAKVRFSLAVAQRKKVRQAIAAIPEDAWTPVKYPKAIWDADEQRWISDAEVAEVEYTAFTGKAKKYHTRARLLIRRVKRLNDAHVPDGQGELFKIWRFHAVFTDSPFELVEAEKCHRAHAIVEQVFANLEDSALGHLPSRKFTANAAWLTLAALAHNLTRALGTLASAYRAKARTGTIRRHLIAVPARLAARGRPLTFHLPERRPWQDAFETLWMAVGCRLRT